MRKLIIGCICILGMSMTYAQDQDLADSVKSLVSSNDLTQEEKLEAYSWLSINSDTYEERLQYGEQLLELATQLNRPDYRIKANSSIGIAHKYLGNLGSALEYLFKSAEEADDSDNFLAFLAEIYVEISTCYTQNGDSENALFYGSKSIGILRQTGSEKKLAYSLLNYGYDYYIIGNYDSAMAYYNESETILEARGSKRATAYVVGNRALVYWKTGNINLAKEELFKSIEVLKSYDDLYAMADYYNQLGNIYLEEGEEEEAIQYTMKGLEMAKGEGLKEQVRDASLVLYQLYSNQKNYEKAIAYQTQYYTYKDSIQNVETTQRLANLRTEYEVGLKQSEVDLLLEQKQSNRIIMIIIISVLFIVICLVIVIYSFYKSKKRLSEQLEKQKDDLVVLNETKDKFFSIISHDLRGPVNSLYGLVAVSKIYINEGKTNRVVDMVNQMDGFVEHLTGLLDTLLNWALNQRGGFPYSPEKLLLKEVVDDTVAISKDMAYSKGIKIEASIQDDLELFADRNSTATILRNLLNNSIKFTNDQGLVTINAEKVGEECVIKVVDNGIGIPKDKLDRLFSLNEKVSTKGTIGEKGIGLGLQLVYEFIQLNKGKIEVESEVDKGTTFTVTLPISQN